MLSLSLEHGIDQIFYLLILEDIPSEDILSGMQLHRFYGPSIVNRPNSARTILENNLTKNPLIS
jgi:hypothetical protein